MNHPNLSLEQVWWLIFVLAALGRLRKENDRGFKTIMSYTLSSRPAYTIGQCIVSKKEKVRKADLPLYTVQTSFYSGINFLAKCDSK